MQRALNVVLALAGMLVLAALILARIDVRRAAATGPRWQRRLLTAALMLAGMAGLYPSAAVADGPASRPAASSAPASQPVELSRTEEWRTITDYWQLTEPMAESGTSTNAERKVHDNLRQQADSSIAQLLEKGMIDQAEAHLLRIESAQLRARVYRNPPSDAKVLCYESTALVSAQQSMKTLIERMPLLEDLAKSGKLHPEVLRRVLASAEVDLARMTDEKQRKQLSPDEQKQAAQFAPTVREQLDAMKAKLPATATQSAK